ncbi:MAG: hypothetical protein HYU59_12200 [Magnetospirillum gryphiswaldense]|nr:hypothetical protein [Magnetospirillum gryphiswaldense]
MLLAAPMTGRAAERALDLLDAPVSYSADFSVSGDKGTYRGSVRHAPGREYRDFTTKDGGQAVILRRDTNAAYLLKPSGKWYVGLGFSAVGALAGGLDTLTIDRVKQGAETVGGVKTTRYKVVGNGPKGSRFDGLAWFSAEGIMVKAAGTLTEANGRASQVDTQLTNLRLGKVDESVFELPAGWFGMDLRSVPPERIAQAVESLRPLLERK